MSVQDGDTYKGVIPRTYGSMPFKTFGSKLITYAATTDTYKFRELPTWDRRGLIFYFFWMKWQFALLVYRQIGLPYNLMDNEPRLKYWMRVYAHLTPLFGGPQKIISNQLSFTTFCTWIAIARNMIMTLPVIAVGRFLIARSPHGPQIAHYLLAEPTNPMLSSFIVPYDLYNKDSATRNRIIESYILRGLPVPPELMPKDELSKLALKKALERLYEGKNLATITNDPFRPKAKIEIPSLQSATRSGDSKSSAAKDKQSEAKSNKGWFKWLS